MRLLLGAAIVASTAVGCGSSTTPRTDGGGDHAGVDSGPLVAPYGTPAPLEMPV